jgi:hypothetical protein
MGGHDNRYKIRRAICEMVRSGDGVDQIQRRLTEGTDDTNMSYASTLVRVRDGLLAAKLKGARA